MAKVGSPPPSSYAAAAAWIARRLHERDDIARACLERIIQMIGIKRVDALADQALHIDSQGGMLTRDGARRRTPGGIFFHLFAAAVTPAQQREIRLLQTRLQEERALRRLRPARKLGALETVNVPLDLTASREIAASLRDDAGKAVAMRIKLIGRPGSIERRDGVVVFQMRADDPPKLPRVLPPLPDAPQIHVVYLAAKHWLKVAAAVEQTDTKIVIEGYAAFDPALGKLVVYARDARVVNRRPTAAPAPNHPPPLSLTEDDTSPTPIPRLIASMRAPEPDANANESRDSRQSEDAPLSLPNQQPASSDLAVRLASMHEEAAYLQRNIAAIQAMPFSQRRDLVTFVTELETLQARIRVLEAQHTR
jgi:hypothetical protein